MECAAYRKRLSAVGIAIIPRQELSSPMHKSRLGGMVIDCRTDDLLGAADFWSEALGLEIKMLPGAEGEKYVKLEEPQGRLDIEVQQVEHESRVHLDIESDDLEAEAKRLEKLGAKRIGKVKGWIVMEAPTGQRFCIVKPMTRDFASDANEWK